MAIALPVLLFNNILPCWNCLRIANFNSLGHLLSWGGKDVHGFTHNNIRSPWHLNAAESRWSSRGGWLCQMQVGMQSTHTVEMQLAKCFTVSQWERRKTQQCRPDEQVSQQGCISEVDSRYRTEQTLDSLELVRERVHVCHTAAGLLGGVCSYRESFFWVADDVIAKKNKQLVFPMEWKKIMQWQ